MSYDLRQGFRLGPWEVDPLTGAVSGPDGEMHHLEPKVMDVFVCLAEHANQLVTRGHLLKTVWSDRPGADELLTGAVSDLRRALRKDGNDATCIATFPKRGYRLTGRVEAPEYLSHDRARGKARMLWATGAAGVAILIALLSLDVRRSVVGPFTEPVASIAVLPLDNYSGDPNQDYFVQGMTDSLISELSKVDGIRVISRFTATAIKDRDVPLSTLADQLELTHVVDGSVLKDGDSIRITAQLIEARSDTHLWSDSFRRDLEDLFDLQDEVSTTIITALADSLGLEVQASRPTVNPITTEASLAIMQARHLWHRQGQWGPAVAAIQRAIEIDPNYAVAHAELAMTLMNERDDFRNVSTAEQLANAQPYIDRAMELDSNLAESQAANCLMHWTRAEPDKALTYCSEALSLNPSYWRVINWMNDIYLDLGLYKESFAMNVRGMAVNPLAIPSRASYLHHLIQMNRLEGADREIEKFATYRPSTYQTLKGKIMSLDGNWGNWSLGYLRGMKDESMLGGTIRNRLTWGFAVVGLEREALEVTFEPGPEVYRWLGRTQEAVAAAKAQLEEDPELLPYQDNLGLALAAAGYFAEAEPYLEGMWRRSNERVTLQGAFTAEHAVALIVARWEAGKETDELIDAIRDNARRYRDAGLVRIDLWRFWTNADYEDGLAAFFSGDEERGLDFIESAAKDAVFIPMRQAFLQDLYDHPGFAPIRDMQTQRQARERVRILGEVCPNAPYADWSPAPESCEPFTTSPSN